MRARIRTGCVTVALGLTLGFSLFSAAQQPATAPVPESRPRLVVIKVDGLSPQLLNALIDPEDPAKLAQLGDAEGYRRAIGLYRAETGRREVIPNIRRYFFEQGVRTENMVAATITLSSVSWSVIETGQPSVVKRHMTFSRQSGHRRSHLDGFRDTWNMVLRSARKTSAVWQLDQAGVSLFSDAFHPERTYVTPWMYYRQTPTDYLSDIGIHWLTEGQDSPWGILKAHLARRVGDLNYPEWQEQFLAHHIAEKVVEKDFAGQERYDFISTFFTIDHQYHVDPNPENIVRRMARIDRRVGQILNAVMRSERRDQTLVAILSDHGSEYTTTSINLSFPLTRMFRTRYLGGHTVSTVMNEDSAHALTNFMQGIDFPRIFEGPYSPYNKGRRGEKDYPTAFIDNFGNARAEVHLRNNDLNRLHLLLMARARKLDNDQRAMFRIRLEETLAVLRDWLEPEYRSYREYYEGVRAWLPFLLNSADSYWSDAGKRMQAEQQRDAEILRRLQDLLKLCRADDPVAWLDQNHPPIPDLLPKKYFGPKNSVHQLSHYTVGLDDNLDWVESVVDPRGRTVPLDYFSVLSHYEVPNPPLSYERNPTNLIATPVPVGAVTRALVERGWLAPFRTLQQAVWVVSTARDNTSRGAQALVVKDTSGAVRYIPVQNLEQDSGGRFTFEASPDLDPLGLYYDPAFQAPDGLPAYLWFRRFHTFEEWVRATCRTQYTIAPLVFLDIAGVNALPFIDNPDFQRTLAGFPNEETRLMYLRGLRWKYAAQQPDLLLWSSYLWNYSSKSHTAGGSHGGLPPHVARTSFLLWGGEQFHLPAGTAITEPATTLDVVPTLARLMGMLDADNRVRRRPGSYRHRPLLRLAGAPLPVANAKLHAQQKQKKTATPAASSHN